MQVSLYSRNGVVGLYIFPFVKSKTPHGLEEILVSCHGDSFQFIPKFTIFPMR